MAFELLERHYSKPTDAFEVDWENPISSGLALLVLQNEQGSSSLDLANRLIGEKRQTSQTLSHDPKFGQGYDFSGASAVVDLGLGSRKSIDTSSERFSGISLVEWDGVDGAILAKRDGNSVEFQISFNSGNLVFRRGGTAADVGLALPTGLSIVGFSFENGICTSYANGVISSSASGFPSSNVLAVNVSLGARWNNYPTTAFQFSGKQYGTAIWTNRVLTADEHKALADNPWQLVKPTGTPVMIQVGSAFNLDPPALLSGDPGSNSILWTAQKP